MRKRIVLMLTGLLLFVAMFAQKELANSHIGLSLEGGGSHLFLGSNLSPIGYSTPKWGYGGGGALYYELEYKHFLFRTGFGVDYTVNNNRLKVRTTRLLSRSIRVCSTITRLPNMTNRRGME